MDKKLTIDGKPATRRHIIIFDEDHDFIKETFSEHPGYSAAIRIIIHEAIDKIRRKAHAKAASAPMSSEGIAAAVESLIQE